MFYVMIIAAWGLDEHGCFNSDGAAVQSSLQRIAALFVSSGSGVDASGSGSVAGHVLQDLKDVIAAVQSESDITKTQSLSATKRGSRLLYLFQRDLLPGVSGKILEAKGQRDCITAQPVSRKVKVMGWAIVILLNVGMWSYILLFALNQTVHRQSAWAMSFALWMVVEIFFVSSCIVLFTHIAIPAIIMKDVNKIKQKLAESIREFNNEVQQRRQRHHDALYLADQDEQFNAAKYLFVSTRLAQQWPELREAQIIAQFRTPWPKQSYQRETNVSGAYNKRYTAFYRSASVIAVFFLTQLLQIPATLQDMVIHMVTTTMLGYTMLAHINLYQIFPVLAFIPVLVCTFVVYYYIKSHSAVAERELCRVQVSQEDDDAKQVVLPELSADTADEDKFNTPRSPSKSTAGSGADTAAVTRSAHPTRRQSVQQGMTVLDRLKLTEPIHECAVESGGSSCSASVHVNSAMIRQHNHLSSASEVSDCVYLQDRLDQTRLIATATDAEVLATMIAAEGEEEEYLKERVELMLRIVHESDAETKWSEDKSVVTIPADAVQSVPPSCSSSQLSSEAMTSEMLHDALLSSRIASRVLGNIFEDASGSGDSVFDMPSEESVSAASIHQPVYSATPTPCRAEVGCEPHCTPGHSTQQTALTTQSEEDSSVYEMPSEESDFEDAVTAGVIEKLPAAARESDNDVCRMISTMSDDSIEVNNNNNNNSHTPLFNYNTVNNTTELTELNNNNNINVHNNNNYNNSSATVDTKLVAVCYNSSDCEVSSESSDEDW